MQKFTVSFLGRDNPGIVAAIAQLLYEADCGILAVSQTILSGDFAAIFMVASEKNLSAEDLHIQLAKGLEAAEVDLSCIVRPTIEGTGVSRAEDEPFVVTADGPDGKGFIAGISAVFARYGINIESLTAILGQEDPAHALSVFEVMVPLSVDLGRLGRELKLEGEQRGLRVSLQHRDIFEAMHRIDTI